MMTIGVKAEMKKILFITVVLVLVFSFAAGCEQEVEEEEGLKLEASTEEGAADGQVVVEVNAENAAGTEGGQFILNFDPNLVEPVSADSGELVKDAENNLFMVNKEYDDGQLKFMWVTALADTADSGTVCEIAFDLFDQGTTALEFADIVVSPDDFAVAEAVSGEISIDDTGVDN